MEKVIGQRVLGGVVLIAAAILFLPMVLEGAGVAALQPPEIPAKPALPSAGDLAPGLQAQAAELEKNIADSHGEPTFYPVQPATQSAPETTEDVPERFRLAETAPVSVAAELEVKPVVKSKPKPATISSAKAESQGLPSAWVVQVASLSNKASADELVTRLRTRGFRAAAVQHGSVFKVSVGPELNRGIADSLKQRLSDDAELKLNGFIVPYRP
jgi:DedD protein